MLNDFIQRNPEVKNTDNSFDEYYILSKTMKYSYFIWLQVCSSWSTKNPGWTTLDLRASKEKISGVNFIKTLMALINDFSIEKQFLPVYSAKIDKTMTQTLFTYK